MAGMETDPSNHPGRNSFRFSCQEAISCQPQLQRVQGLSQRLKHTIVLSVGSPAPVTEHGRGYQGNPFLGGRGLFCGFAKFALDQHHSLRLSTYLSFSFSFTHGQTSFAPSTHQLHPHFLLKDRPCNVLVC